MRNPRLLAAALAAGLLGASAASGANHGVEARPGDRFTGEVSTVTDVDSFVVDIGAGSRFSVDLRAAAGSTLRPILSVRSPAGDPATMNGFLRGEGGPRVTLKNLPIPSTGTWLVNVASGGGTAGAYEIVFAAKSPTRFASRGLSVPAGGEESVAFTAGEGALLSFTLKLRGGGLPAGVALIDPDGEEFPIPAGLVTAKGKKITGKSIPLSGPFGTWGLRISALPARDSLVDAAVQVRLPKPRKLVATLGPEPRPTSLAPGSGRDGTPFTVEGTGFDPAARVRFGETWVEGAVVTGGTGATGLAPDGEESRLGLQVAVVVANPDGQENAAPGAFNFLGIPKPESVNPRFQPPEGGRPLLVKGKNFRAGFSLSIGGIPRPEATLTPLGDIFCLSPAHDIGTAAIVVTDEFGRPGTLAAGVTYIGPPAPASAVPPSSSFTGGRVHLLVGTSFRPGLRVFVDGIECEGVEEVDTTHLKFAMPAGPAGALDVSVTDEFDRTGSAAGIVRRRGPFKVAPEATLPAPPASGDFFARSAALGDLDGDGRADILLAATYPGYDPVTYEPLSATMMLVQGADGTFTDATAALLGPFGHAEDHGDADFALLGDLDGQPGGEIVLSTAYPISAQYSLFQKGGKSYAYATLGYYGSPYPDYPTYTATRFLSRTGGASFTERTLPWIPASTSTPFIGYGERFQARAGALGDLDGDGDLDLVLSAPAFIVKGSVASTTYTGGVYYLIQGYQYLSSTRVLRNGGDGVFTTTAASMPSPIFMNGNYAARVAEEFDASTVSLGDLDGDGDLDMVLARSYPKYVYHLDTVTGKYTTYYITALRVLDNDGTGTFLRDAAAVPVPPGSGVAGSSEFWQATATALGDLDGDGDLDLVIGRNSINYSYDAATTSYKLEPALRIFSNDGAGKFTDASASFLPAAAIRGGGPGVILDARSVVLGDLDGDDRLDLVVTGMNYYVYGYGGAPYGPNGLLPAGEHVCTHIFLNDGAGKLVDRTSAWLPVPVNGDLFQAGMAVLGDLDGDGDLDLVLTSEYAPYSSQTLPYTYNRPLRVLKCE